MTIDYANYDLIIMIKLTQVIATSKVFNYEIQKQKFEVHAIDSPEISPQNLDKL